VAHTSRNFEAFARRRNLPFLCVRAGGRAAPLRREGSVTTLELPRARFSIALDKGLCFDPVWFRHIAAVSRVVRDFHPEIIHITGPSEVGMLGAWLAYRLRIPLAASWHTNLHQYAAMRSRWLFEGLGAGTAAQAMDRIEQMTLWLVTRMYRRAGVLFAPNPELCRLLERRTGRPCRLMQRGIDGRLFSPERREREAGDRDFILGYVGRLSVEKNVGLVIRVQRELESRGIRNFRFRIVGQGREEAWLRECLPRAEFTGVLGGEDLARAYAGMDLFVFPSHTDTFGNVVLEALACGVPAVVTPDGGPRSLVRHGRTGLVGQDADFPAAIASILADAALHASMRQEARAFALAASWDGVFEKVYAAYTQVLINPEIGASAGQ